MCPISNLIQKSGLINLDFSDVSAVMRDGPYVFVGVGESNTENRIEDAISRALSHPLMRADISGAQSILLHITSGPGLKMREGRQAVKCELGKRKGVVRVYRAR